MSLANDSNRLAVIEGMANQVIRPQALPGIDISPLIDALVQFLLQLLDDCPMQDIRRAVEQSTKRPVIRLFWQMRLNARMPAKVRRNVPDAASDLLSAGANMNADQWAALED